MIPAPLLGLAFPPTLPPERLRAVAGLAEDSGLDELWVCEDCFKESGIAMAATALACTRRISVGLGFLPAPLRNVALTAMEIATLSRLFPHRLVPGVGHGVQHWMGQAGARVESPLSLLAEYATALRRLLAGEEVTTNGRYVRLDRVRLDWPADPVPPLMLGGAGSRSLELTGRLGDGTLLPLGLTDERVRRAVGLVRRAAAGPRRIVAVEIAATGPGARGRVDEEVARWFGDAGAGVGAAGDAAGIAGRVRRLAEAGATSVVITPTAGEPGLEALVDVLGAEVRPLLHRIRGSA